MAKAFFMTLSTEGENYVTHYFLSWTGADLDNVCWNSRNGVEGNDSEILKEQITCKMVMDKEKTENCPCTFWLFLDLPLPVAFFWILNNFY